jgi:hypothetical protein
MALLKEATNINISAKWSFANFCFKKNPAGKESTHCCPGKLCCQAFSAKNTN